MITLIDFYADWCPPCRIMDPVMEEIGKEFEGRVTFEKVNVDEDREKAQKFMVMSIPTFVIVKDGKEIDRKMGAVPKEVMAEWIESSLV